MRAAERSADEIQSVEQIPLWPIGMFFEQTPSVASRLVNIRRWVQPIIRPRGRSALPGGVVQVGVDEIGVPMGMHLDDFRP